MRDIPSILLSLSIANTRPRNLTPIGANREFVESRKRVALFRAEAANDNRDQVEYDKREITI